MKAQLEITEVKINDLDTEIVIGEKFPEEQREEYLQFLTKMLELCPYVEPSNTMH